MPATLDGPIDYRRTSGQGGAGPAIHIELTGTATTSHTCRPPATIHLDHAVLADLRHKISSADLSTLKASYLHCRDCDYETVSAQLGGRVYTIPVGLGVPDLPPRLRALTSTLRALAGPGLIDDDGEHGCDLTTAKR